MNQLKLLELGIHHGGSNHILGLIKSKECSLRMRMPGIVQPAFQDFIDGETQIIRYLTEIAATTMRTNKDFLHVHIDNMLQNLSISKAGIYNRMLQRTTSHVGQIQSQPYISEYIKNDYARSSISRELRMRLRIEENAKAEASQNGIHNTENTHFLHRHSILYGMR